MIFTWQQLISPHLPKHSNLHYLSVKYWRWRLKNYGKKFANSYLSRRLYSPQPSALFANILWRLCSNLCLEWYLWTKDVGGSGLEEIWTRGWRRAEMLLLFFVVSNRVIISDKQSWFDLRKVSLESLSFRSLLLIAAITPADESSCRWSPVVAWGGQTADADCSSRQETGDSQG